MVRATFWILLPLVCVHATNAAPVSGTVAGPGGSAIEKARVTISDPTLTFFREARTDAQGSFSFADVPAGSYRIGASARNLEYVEDLIEVSSTPARKAFALGPEIHPGRWSVVGSTLPEFFDATDIAILRDDGKVFFCHDTKDPVVFDPMSGEKSFPKGSDSAQGCMNGTVLEDGRIIMVGGQTPEDPGSFRNAVRWVKTYSPAKNVWTRLADLQLSEGRWYTSLARLADGSLLAMGGGTRPSAARTATCERFDLVDETWTFTGSMLNPTEFPPCALLYSGEVLATWWPPQLYDPKAGTWRPTGNFKQPNRGWPNHSDHSLVVLSDGRALAIGVRRDPDNNQVMGEIYDPAAGAWSFTSNPGLIRLQPEVVQLPDGRIFVGAGETQSSSPPVPTTLGVVTWCDIYDPGTDRWRRVADMEQFREYHAVTILVPDGRVLTTGGTLIKFQVGPTSADIEAYEPPYLFRGVRPKIMSLDRSEIERGGALSMQIEPLTAITSVVLMGTPSTTHWVDSGIRRHLILPVTQEGGTVRAVLPVDPNLLPLGHYLLFAMVDDVPSVARVVKVVEAFARFRRGDSNGDGALDVSDAVFALNYLFLDGEEPPCLDAADSNDDGSIDISDAVRLLLSLFGGVPPLSMDCENDPTPDGFTCEPPGCS